MILSDFIGQGEVVERIHDLDKSLNFLRMLLFLSMVVTAKLLHPGIFSWLGSEVFNLGRERGFTDKGPEEYVFAMALLLLFSIVNVGVLMAHHGVFANFGSPVLINLSLSAFVITMMLTIINFFQLALFGIKTIFNPHFVDFLIYIILLGIGAFLVLLAQWFLQPSLVVVIQAATYLVLCLVFLWRIVRLIFKGGLIFKQNMLLIFCYLCAAEIGPLLIVGKLLTNLA